VADQIQLQRITACDSYTWQGTTYTMSGTYTKTSLNAFNCVHTDTLQLSIHQSSGSNSFALRHAIVILGMERPTRYRVRIRKHP
jgi:hypothetical protein